MGTSHGGTSRNSLIGPVDPLAEAFAPGVPVARRLDRYTLGSVLERKGGWRDALGVPVGVFEPEEAVHPHLIVMIGRRLARLHVDDVDGGTVPHDEVCEPHEAKLIGDEADLGVRAVGERRAGGSHRTSGHTPLTGWGGTRTRWWHEWREGE